MPFTVPGTSGNVDFQEKSFFFLQIPHVAYSSVILPLKLGGSLLLISGPPAASETQKEKGKWLPNLEAQKCPQHFLSENGK